MPRLVSTQTNSLKILIHYLHSTAGTWGLVTCIIRFFFFLLILFLVGATLMVNTGKKSGLFSWLVCRKSTYWRYTLIFFSYRPQVILIFFFQFFQLVVNINSLEQSQPGHVCFDWWQRRVKGLSTRRRKHCLTITIFKILKYYKFLNFFVYFTSHLFCLLVHAYEA